MSKAAIAAEDRPLTAMQARFVAGYVARNNATQAYRDAGYKCDGKTDNIRAGKLLQKANVAKAVAAGREKVAKELELDTRVVYQHLSALAFSNMALCIDEQSGLLKNPHEMPPATQVAVCEVTQEVVRTESDDERGVRVQLVRQKLKLHPKVPALLALAKAVGLKLDAAKDDQDKAVEDYRNLPDEQLARIAAGDAR